MQGAYPHSHGMRIDLGDEPPLLAGDSHNGPPDRKRVNIRWLAGTVLTGVTSFTLMGVALFIALEGQHTLARTPDSADAGSQLAALNAGGEIRKGDKIVRKQIRAPARRNVIQVSTVRQEGDRNLIRKRPFVLVSSPLTLEVDDTIAAVPEFNPTRLFSGETTEPEPAELAEKIYEADVEGDVAISRSAFPLDATFARPDTVLTDTAVIAALQQRSLDAPDTSFTASLQAYAPVGDEQFELPASPAVGAESSVRIVAENMSIIKKRQAHGVSARGYDEEMVPVLKDQSIAEALQERGVDETVGLEVSKAFTENYRIDSVQRGQQLRIAYERPEFSDGQSQVIRVSIYAEAEHRATVAIADAGTFIAATPPQDLNEIWLDEMDAAVAIAKGGPTPSVYKSLYQTAFENQVPREMVDELVSIFTFDLDFRGRVRPGDMVEVFYALDEDGPDGGAAGEILYTAIEQNGLERRYYRFKSPDDGSIGYYDEDGKSAKKFLMRKPVSSGKYRSGFGMRRHPILGYKKMHAGVDWAAPRGTPIMAAGDGVVVEAKWQSGYGKAIRIRHANGYETTYSHQSRFAKGIKAGTRVSQGQVIGYVGSTGLSTGPHLHYEVFVNNRNVNPMRIRLPRGQVLSASALASFKKERSRIAALVDRARNSNMIARN